MISPSKPVRAPSWRKVFGAPAIIGLLTLTGLVSTLLLDGPGRYFSWVAVGSPVLIVLWRVVRQPNRS